MAAIYSTRFLQQVGASLDFFYEVPTGFVAVLRCVDVYQGAVLSSNSLYLQGALAQTIHKWTGGDDQDVISQWTGRQVFSEGETITMHNVGGFDWDYTLSGYLLTAP